MKKTEVARVIKTTTRIYNDETVTVETKIMENGEVVVKPKVIRLDEMKKIKAKDRGVVRKIDEKRVEYVDGNYNHTVKTYEVSEDNTFVLVGETYEYTK